MSDPIRDHDAERIVLGSMMGGPARVVEEIVDVVNVADFDDPRHEVLFAAIVAAHAENAPRDPVAVVDRLGSEVRRVGGAPYIAQVHAAPPTHENGPYFARIVAAKAVLRRLQHAADRIRVLTEADGADLEEVVAAARAEVDAAANRRATSEALAFGDLLLEAAERWEQPDTTVLPTGWHDLDDRLNGGLRPGHLCVLGARPAVGKSVAASVLAAFAAGRGIGTLFVSLEMPHREVVDRVAANVAGIDLSRLQRSELTDIDWQRVARLQSQAASWPLWVDDRAGNTVQGIRGRARDVSRSNSGLGLVVVDYLQIVRHPDRRVSREQAVSEITKGLRAIGREFEVPVVALAQVNRESTRATDQRPTMSQLRESGAIEADADEVILLHRDDEESPGEIEFNLEKCRNGRTGRVTLAWAPHYSRIASFAKWEEAAS